MMSCFLLELYGDPETHTRFIVPVWYSCGKCSVCDRESKTVDCGDNTI